MVSPLAPQEAGVDVFLISFLSQCLNHESGHACTARGAAREGREVEMSATGAVCPPPLRIPVADSRAPAAVSLRHTSLTTYRVKRKEILISLLGGDGTIADKTEGAALK